jgi:phosphohistidine phosphatase
LLRHGIAEDGRPGSPDADRALTSEGKTKLREVLRLARAADVRPSLILTSPYRRAIETAEIAAEVLSVKHSMVRSRALEPGANPESVWDEIRAHKSSGDLLLAGHEPLFSQLTGFLLGTPQLRIDFKKGMLVRIGLDASGSVPRGVLKWALTPKIATAE